MCGWLSILPAYLYFYSLIFKYYVILVEYAQCILCRYCSNNCIIHIFSMMYAFQWTATRNSNDFNVCLIFKFVQCLNE